MKLSMVAGAVNLRVDLVFTSAKSAGSKQQLESSHFDADQAGWPVELTFIEAKFVIKEVTHYSLGFLVVHMV